MTSQHLTCRLRKLHDLDRRLPVRIRIREHQDLAGFDRPFLVAIAPSCCLSDGVQPCLGPHDHGKGHIHPGLDQTGGDNSAGLVLPKGFTYSCQRHASVLCTHQRAEVDGSRKIFQSLVHSSGMQPVVYDAQNLTLFF